MRRGITMSMAAGAAALALALVLALAGPAQAKGIQSATITGPGLDEPIAVAHSRRDSGDLARLTAVWEVMPGQPQTPALMDQAPTGQLGPRYRITWRLMTDSDETDRDPPGPLPLRGRWSAGPHPAGQLIFDGSTSGGWYGAPIALRDMLGSLGVPAAVPPRQPVTSPQPAGGGRVLGPLAVAVVRRRGGWMALASVGGPSPSAGPGGGSGWPRSRSDATMRWWAGHPTTGCSHDGRRTVTWTPTPRCCACTRVRPPAGAGGVRFRRRRRRGGAGWVRQGLVRPGRVPRRRRLPALALAYRGQRGPQPPPVGRPARRHELRFAEDRASGGAAPLARGAVPRRRPPAYRRRGAGRAAAAPAGRGACRYLVGLDEAETAAVLGLPRGTVKSRAARGLARLRDLLPERIEIGGSGDA